LHEIVVATVFQRLEIFQLFFQIDFKNLYDSPLTTIKKMLHLIATTFSISWFPYRATKFISRPLCNQTMIFNTALHLTASATAEVHCRATSVRLRNRLVSLSDQRKIIERIFKDTLRPMVGFVRKKSKEEGRKHLLPAAKISILQAKSNDLDPPLSSTNAYFPRHYFFCSIFLQDERT
jgi:hypothetical protein